MAQLQDVAWHRAKRNARLLQLLGALPKNRGKEDVRVRNLNMTAAYERYLRSQE
jgi:D-amino-acid oxidase